jgi:plasmid stabilization system protein ParE
MPRVVLVPTALEDLSHLEATRVLPTNTRQRLRAVLEPLEQFPEMGPPLHGAWDGFRFLLGPWAWMIVVYVYDRERDEVAVVAIHDARTMGSATHG